MLSVRSRHGGAWVPRGPSWRFRWVNALGVDLRSLAGTVEIGRGSSGYPTGPLGGSVSVHNHTRLVLGRGGVGTP